MTILELETLLGEIVLNLNDIMSFGLGALSAISFVIAAAMKWR